MIRKIHQTHLIPVLLLLIMLVTLLVNGVDSAYTVYFVETEIMSGENEQQVALVAKGGNMLRVNSLYIDGKRVRDCIFEKETYNQCRFTFDESAFDKGNTWYELRVGYHKWGFIDLLSGPVWIEWTGA